MHVATCMLEACYINLVHARCVHVACNMRVISDACQFILHVHSMLNSSLNVISAKKTLKLIQGVFKTTKLSVHN